MGEEGVLCDKGCWCWSDDCDGDGKSEGECEAFILECCKFKGEEHQDEGLEVSSKEDQDDTTTGTDEEHASTIQFC